MCIYIYIYIHICMHVYTHIYACNKCAFTHTYPLFHTHTQTLIPQGGIQMKQNLPPAI